MINEIIGYFLAVLIGVSLGMIGAGGSILTVPVLVYLFGYDAKIATAYSLFIVGITSFIGSIQHYRIGQIKFQTALIFGIPSVIGVFISRAYIIPAIPKYVFSIGNFRITDSVFIMLLFATMMLASSYSMIKDVQPVITKPVSKSLSLLLVATEGVVVGILTGLVGAGGGFLIIPALVLLSGISIKDAIGTSLVIITAKSLIGFFSDQHITNIDWFFLITISALAIAGNIIGFRLATKIDSSKLKPAFGIFIFIIGIYIIINEVFLK